jgi:hypothetical protein
VRPDVRSSWLLIPSLVVGLFVFMTAGARSADVPCGW